MKFNVYLVENKAELTCLISSDINVDLAFWYQQGISDIKVLVKQFSIGHAAELSSFLQQKSTSPLSFLKKNGYDIETFTTKQGFELIFSKYQSWKESLLSLFEGRLLLPDEIIKLNSTSTLSATLKIELNSLLQIGYLLEDIGVNPGVSYPYDIRTLRMVNNLKCNHCGENRNIIIQKCAICDDYCATCENCISIGRSKSCIPLYYFFIRSNKAKDTFMVNKISIENLQLSSFQKKVADNTVGFIQDKNKKEFLIWAVTGAGKTEMVFPAIKSALEQGDKVLFTAPRRDVIIDLAVRFKKTFSDIPIVSLYGGSEDKWKEGRLYLATANQTIRFINFFDLAIIDELDAYPFQNNQSLQYMVKRSLKDSAKTIMMSATPPCEWLIRIKQKTIDYEILPVRYHGQPLPIPIIKILPKKTELLKSKKPFSIIRNFLDEVKKKNGNSLIFVSRVKEINIWTEKLREWFPTERIEGIHANDPLRDKKIKFFKEKKINHLVTTTILERGVTFTNLHVLVIDTESTIFDEATLVQIAGRVGRSAEFPSGLVWFLTEYVTNDILKAKKQINKMNKLAKKLDWD